MATPTNDPRGFPIHAVVRKCERYKVGQIGKTCFCNILYEPVSYGKKSHSALDCSTKKQSKFHRNNTTHFYKSHLLTDRHRIDNKGTHSNENYVHCVSQKGATFIFAITLANVDRF